MTKNSVHNSKNGRYTLGGTTEVSTFAIEWWDKNKVRHDPSDIVYYVEKQYEFKPQLLGYLFYGDANLWWVICQSNGIIDPLTELYEGKLLLIPTMDRVKSEIFSTSVKVGGIPSSRTS
jgi:hypothetical protein